MDIETFRQSLAQAEPPPDIGLAAQGLWWDAKGDWDAAHHCAQEQDDRAGAWVHAYLHRKEGDDSNAAYWYSRAGRRSSQATLEEEWEEIAVALLAEPSPAAT
jgi:hypothetical protein